MLLDLPTGTLHLATAQVPAYRPLRDMQSRCRAWTWRISYSRYRRYRTSMPGRTSFSLRIPPAPLHHPLQAHPLERQPPMGQSRQACLLPHPLVRRQGNPPLSYFPPMHSHRKRLSNDLWLAMTPSIRVPPLELAQGSLSYMFAIWLRVLPRSRPLRTLMVAVLSRLSSES